MDVNGAPKQPGYKLRRGMEGDQFVALLKWYGSPGFFDSDLQLICIFMVSWFSFSSWQYPIDSLWGSGLASLLASQAHQHHGHLTNFWCFWQCGQVPNPAWKWISIFKKLVSRRKHEVLQNVLVNGCSDVGLKKHSGPTPADFFAPQIITDCGNLTLDFKQLGLWASPPFLLTLGPWFPNEIQNLLSSEKRTLDHWATVQFFFSLTPGSPTYSIFLR